MLKRMLNTFFEYSKSLVQPGYRTSLYNYLYNYKIRDRLMSVTDIIVIKILVLIDDL